MKIMRGLKNFKKPEKGAVLTIGVFDGVHIGHREVIRKAVSAARRSGLKSIVLTFDPHPMRILHPVSYTPSIISFGHRIRLIEELGADMLAVLNFTKAVAVLSPERFVKDILVNKLGAKEIYVSDNFYFGRSANAGIDALKQLGLSFGFKVKVVKPVKINKKRVSSSLIRALIISGRIGEASKFLGRPVSVLGTVASGASLARELGYPTANINPHHEVIPPSGVYAVMVRLDNKVFKGVLNIGVRPTFYAPRDREPAIEAHLFDFHNQIYGKELEVYFIKKIRDEKHFKGKDELVGQIKKDEKAARGLLRRY